MLLDSRAKIALRQHVDILVANTVNVLLTTTVFRPSAPVILVILGGNASSLATVMAVVFVECQPKDFQLALNVMLVSVENIAKRNAQTSAAGMVTVTNMVNVNAIKDFPMINVSVDGKKIVRHKDINVGMAAALPSGNLIVPVIKKADQLSLSGLTTKVNDLANRARNNKLKPDEIQGGTFTLTNVGTFGNVMGTPIINQPQVAIMATGAIRKKPAVLETEHGDVIAIRHMMFLSLSYDHRVVDGMLGGSFLRRVADYLESFSPDRDI